MTTPRDKDDRPALDPSDPEMADLLRELSGEEPAGDQDAVLSPDEIEEEPETTDTELYLGDRERSGSGDFVGAEDAESLEGLADRDLREGETDDPYVASDEGLAYVPPSDPPTIPSEDPQGIDIAAGTGSTAIDEPYDEDHAGELLSVESGLTPLVREALENDGATSGLADRIVIGTIGGIVVLRGTVDSLDDGDALVEVVSRVSGVDEVRDETEVAGL